MVLRVFILIHVVYGVLGYEEFEDGMLADDASGYRYTENVLFFVSIICIYRQIFVNFTAAQLALAGALAAAGLVTALTGEAYFL